MAEKIIGNLRRFNRKERYHLIKTALSIPEFKLGECFMGRLRECLGLQVPVDAFVAMDYHLDWVYASLFLACRGVDGGVFPRSKDKITATQEDIDLLIAYGEDNVCHLLFLEAKGVGGFTNEQLNSKAKRLKTIFEEDWPSVKPHFALISRKEPDQNRLNREEWPKWMHCKGKPNWVKLDWPDNSVSVSRSDKEGKRLATGKFWKIQKDKL